MDSVGADQSRVMGGVLIVWRLFHFCIASLSGLLEPSQEGHGVYETEIGKVGRILCPCLSFLVVSDLGSSLLAQILADLILILFAAWELQRLSALQAKKPTKLSVWLGSNSWGNSRGEKARTAAWLLAPGMILTLFVAWQ